MRPLRRSITFWSGLFVLVSLLWLLVDSHRMPCSLRMKAGFTRGAFSAGSFDGRMGFSFTSEDPGPRSGPVLTRKPRQSWTPKPIDLRLWHFLMPATRSGDLYLSLPLPLLILLHLGLWFLLMHRRRLRLQNAELTSPTLPSSGEKPVAS